MVNEWLDQEGLYRPNVENLAQLCNQLGYKPFNSCGGPQSNPAGYIEEFLKDNPGAIEALFDWVEENAGEEWKDALNVDDMEEGSDEENKLLYDHDGFPESA